MLNTVQKLSNASPATSSTRETTVINKIRSNIPLREVKCVATFLSILLIWAVLQAGIAGVENDQRDKRQAESKAEVRGVIIEDLRPTVEALNEAIYDGLKACRIDNVFRRYNSPLTGYEYIFIREGKRTRINPYLPAAIAGKESYFASQCFAPYNAWGMLAYPQGFSSWEEGIRVNFDWLQHWYSCPQSAYDCRGYCVPDHPWMEDIQAIIGMIGR